MNALARMQKLSRRANVDLLRMYNSQIASPRTAQRQREALILKREAIIRTLQRGPKAVTKITSPLWFAD